MAKQPPFQVTPASESSRVDREPDSTAGLLSRLMGEVSTLFRKEIALAKAEVSEAASEAKAGAISLVAGGAIVFAAVLVLLGAIVLLLAERMEPGDIIVDGGNAHVVASRRWVAVVGQPRPPQLAANRYLQPASIDAAHDRVATQQLT